MENQKKFPNKRVFAFLVDLFLVSVISLSAPWGWVIGTIYILIRDALFRGRSVGKLVTGLAVLDPNGNRAGLKESVLRNLPFAVPFVFFPIEYFVMIRSKEGKRLGDRIAHTQVIDTRPHQKDSLFLWLSLLFLFLFVGALAYPRVLTEKEARALVVSLEEYQKTHGTYPKTLNEFKVKHRSRLIYTPYLSYRGSVEFYLTGISTPNPENISYSSERREWRDHRKEMPWTKEEMSINRATEEAESHYQKGISFQTKGALDEAIQEYREAIQLFPLHMNARLGLASALRDKGLKDKALAEYDALVKLQPNNVEAPLNRHRIFLEQGRYPEALEAYRAYRKLTPRAVEEDPKKARRTERMLIALSRGHGKKTPPPSTPVSQPIIAAPRPEEKRPKEETANPIQRGGVVLLLLRNGQRVKGRVVDKNSSGVWLEIAEGARAYFSDQEIEKVEALKEERVSD